MAPASIAGFPLSLSPLDLAQAGNLMLCSIVFTRFSRDEEEHRKMMQEVEERCS